MIQKTFAAILLAALILSLAACQVTFSPLGSGTPNASDMENTAAAQTVSALQTSIVAGRKGTVVSPAQTTPIPTITLTPTPKPVYTNTPGPDCNRAEFVGDITIPDGSSILPNSTFTKTWLLKNTGTCAWNNTYSVIFAGKGSALNAQAAQPLVRDGEVKPGESAPVSVTLRAPGETGDYESYWKLRQGNDKVFGIGAGGQGAFFLKIHVTPDEYSFAQHMCSAEWSSGAGKLPCPGGAGDSKGYVQPDTNPAMEDNQAREGFAWLAAPQPVGNGYIVGKFPAVIVPDHSDFRAILSCTPGATGCYVHLKVTYQVDNGKEEVLGEWNEGHEGGVTEVVKDLDMVAGRSTAFNFYVIVSGGTPDQSKAVWFNPRIIKN